MSIARSVVSPIARPLVRSLVQVDGGGGGPTPGPGPNDVVSNGQAVTSMGEQVTSTP